MKNNTREETFYRLSVLTLIAIISALIIYSLIFFSYRMSMKITLDYNEGWNVFHTERLLAGQNLYIPVVDHQLTPVNYPPLSFIFIGLISVFTGQVWLIGRIVSAISLLTVAYLIFQIIHHLTKNKLASFLGPLLWLAYMSKMAPHYMFMNDPQMLAHVFSVMALYFYIRWREQLDMKRAFLIALFCCLSVFTKHLLVVMPITIAISMFIENRKYFLSYVTSGVLLTILFLFGCWLLGGSSFFANFIDAGRITSTDRMFYGLKYLFLKSGGAVLFIPCLIMFFVAKKNEVIIIIFFILTTCLGVYVSRGYGVDINAWFELFIAASIMLGLLVAKPDLHIERMQFLNWIHPDSNRLWMVIALSFFFMGIIFNEFFVREYLSPDGILGPKTVSQIRFLQMVSLISGGIILAILKMRITRNYRNYLYVIKKLLIIVICFLPFLWGFKALAQKNLNYLTLNEKKKVYHQDIQLLRGIDGPVLSEDILFAYFAKKDFRYDPFSTTQLIINKKIPEEIIVRRIREKYYSGIVLFFDLDRAIQRYLKKHPIPYPNDRVQSTMFESWTDNTLLSIYDNYELVNKNHIADHFIYMPRK